MSAAANKKGGTNVGLCEKDTRRIIRGKDGREAVRHMDTGENGRKRSERRNQKGESVQDDLMGRGRGEQFVAPAFKNAVGVGKKRRKEGGVRESKKQK